MAATYDRYRQAAISSSRTRSSHSHFPSSSSSSSTHASSKSGGDIIVHDRAGKRRYRRGHFLGKGGFAKCYELYDCETGKLYAGKIVSKSTLAKHKAKEKLTAEIRIHRSMSHKHIVGFSRYFEDSDNVYILLECCESKSLMELHKRRRAITEPEARYYMHQIVLATQYMHGRNVIHRDLKLGNLFLDRDLQVKVGDFGLATTITYPGERKKTLCGTPNYIAPEILSGTDGHSFEVDAWSIGCIMYTLLVGKPPFETDNIKTTYRKIKANDYTIPGSARISEDGRSLIRELLHRNPKSRPKASEMLDHPFFSSGPLPRALPQSALTMPPSVSALDLEAKEMAKVRSNGSSSGNSIGRGVLKAINRNPADIGSKGTKSQVGKGKPVPLSGGGSRRESLETLHSTLDGVLQKFAGAKGGINAATPAPEIKRDEINSGLWITKWVDYSNKYGLGYQLSDESVGVLFNDSTKMILNYDGKTVEFVAREKDGGKTTRMSLEDFPADYKKKITLLKYFNNYMTEHLLRGGGDMVKGRAGGSGGMPYVKKWLRTKHAIVFRLSNNIVQINFFDHTKFILNATGGVATYINKQKVAKTYRLDDLCKSTWRGHGVIMERLAYARDVVGFMRGGKAPKTPSASSEC